MMMRWCAGEFQWLMCSIIHTTVAVQLKMVQHTARITTMMFTLSSSRISIFGLAACWQLVEEKLWEFFFSFGRGGSRRVSLERNFLFGFWQEGWIRIDRW